MLRESSGTFRVPIEVEPIALRLLIALCTTELFETHLSETNLGSTNYCPIVGACRFRSHY